MLTWAVFVCIASGTSTVAADTPPNDGELRPIRLQLKWQHQFQFAGYYAALERGYYRDEGFDVEILEAVGDEDPVDVVTSGRAEFGIGTSELVLFRSRGYPVVLLAPIFQHSPLDFLARVDSGIQSIHDLAGRQVAVERQAAELFAYLSFEGIDPDIIDRVPHPFTPQPMIDGELDVMSAYSTDEPFLLREAGVDYLIFTPRAGGIDFYGDSLFTTSDLAESEPEVARAFLRASLRGWQYALANKEEMVDLIYTRYSQRHSREHLYFEARQTLRLVLPEIVELGYINEGRWQYIGEIYKDQGLIDSVPDLNDFFFLSEVETDLEPVYRTIRILLLMLLVALLITLWFYRLNMRLQKEIHDRKIIEADLHQVKERYRLLVENAPSPIVITDAATGTIRYLNPRAEELIRTTRDKILGREVVGFYADPTDREKLLPILEKQGRVDEAKVRIKRMDGTLFWAQISATKVIHEDAPGYFVVFTDVTALQEAEEQQRRNNEELMAITASVPAMIARIDKDFRCLFVNNTFEKWMGIPRERLEGRDVCTILTPEGGDSMRSKLSLCFSDTNMRLEFEREIETMSGHKVMSIQVVPHVVGGAVESAFIVATDITATKHQEVELRQMASVDALTGLLNRRECLRCAGIRFERDREAHTSMAVAMIDIDNFKQTNDVHGHAAGDVVLREFAMMLEEKLRETDILGRVGGEEFLVVLSGTSPASTGDILDRLRQSVEEMRITHNGDVIPVTVSIGYSMMTSETKSFDALVQAADKALYKAKETGRNQVCAADEPV